MIIGTNKIKPEKGLSGCTGCIAEKNDELCYMISQVSDLCFILDNIIYVLDPDNKESETKNR